MQQFIRTQSGPAPRWIKPQNLTQFRRASQWLILCLAAVSSALAQDPWTASANNLKDSFHRPNCNGFDRRGGGHHRHDFCFLRRAGKASADWPAIWRCHVSGRSPLYGLDLHLSTMRPTYRSLNKHLTLMGCDRQLMIAAMFVGFGLFVTLSSVTVGLVTFGCFAVLGRFKAKDPAHVAACFSIRAVRVISTTQR